MKGYKIYIVWCIACLLLTSILPSVLFSAEIPHPETYIPTMVDFRKNKAAYDDPRPYLKTFGLKQILPKKLYERLIFDEGEMKSLWADLVGFKAPDVVGRIAPEIKPGKYTYKDLEKYPGLKQLMPPLLYERIKPGGPPFGGNIPEFEVIPTRQYYYALPVAEATKRNLGKTKLDDKGYIVWQSWEGGYPFPQPSGPFKAQQVMYNVEKRCMSWDQNLFMMGEMHGYTKNLMRDFDGSYTVRQVRFAGRSLLPPYGWYDKRAQENGEMKSFVMNFVAPRDVAGATQSALYYLNPDKADLLMVYIPSLRRVRKLSATDTQDPNMGQDTIYDDSEGWMQKLSPTRYPYKYEILEEREFLLPAPTIDGAEYISSKGLEFRNMRFERRPIYVVRLTQLDPNYVYSYRIFYIDKETFNYYQIENYDQKKRLYRSVSYSLGWHPEMGMFSGSGPVQLFKDHIDIHCGVQQPLQVPAFWDRRDISIEGFIKQK